LNEDVQKCLAPDDLIIVYCTDEACNWSILLYQQLVLGYEKIFRFAGGLLEWEAAGYELVGEMAA
jgi:3-mercaptopyruvate sulfurtransferase SseA